MSTADFKDMGKCCVGRKVSMFNETRAYEKAGTKGRSDTFRSFRSSFPVMYNTMVFRIILILYYSFTLEFILQNFFNSFL